MTTAHNRINRLRQHGLTWDSLGRELATTMGSENNRVARNTLRSLQNLPHYKPGKNLVAAITHLHDRYFPSPYPQGVNALMNVCRGLMREKNEEAARQLAALQNHIKEQLTLAQHPDLLACRLYWALGNIQQFHMRQARLKKAKHEEIEKHQTQAIQCYKHAITFIESKAMPLEHYKLQHNIFVCYVNAIKEELRNDDKQLIEQLGSLYYADAAKSVLQQESFQWDTARNGLLYASLTKNRQAVAFFFEALIMANKVFLDLDYRPLACDSLLKDPSIKWALREVLRPDFVQAIKDKMERQQPLNRTYF